MLSISNATLSDLVSDEPTLALAPEEIASLTSLMEQFDQVLLGIDALNGRLQELLDIESPAKIAVE